MSSPTLHLPRTFTTRLNFSVKAGIVLSATPRLKRSSIEDKELPEYHALMRGCFEEYYRALKPGPLDDRRVLKSSAAVWNAIQAALQQAGFVVANVSAMDKQQGSYRQVTSTTANRTWDLRPQAQWRPRRSVPKGRRE